MIVASGFVEVNELNDVEKIIDELKMRDIEVDEVKDEKIVFLIERESMAQVRTELDSLRDIDGVRGVYLTYYSLERADEPNL